MLVAVLLLCCVSLAFSFREIFLLWATLSLVLSLVLASLLVLLLLSTLSSERATGRAGERARESSTEKAMMTSTTAAQREKTAAERERVRETAPLQSTLSTRETATLGSPKPRK